MEGIHTNIGDPVELVIFDCDGVLIDSEAIATRATVQTLQRLGYHVSEADAYQRFVGRSYASIECDVEADWGKALPTSFSAELEALTLLMMKGYLQPIPGIATLLSTLTERRCVASSSSIAWIRQGLTTTQLIHHFEPHLFSADMVESGKPAPDIFLHAAKMMDAAPEACVVVEDSLPGVQAGVAAGMRVIGFTGGSHIVDPKHGDRLKNAGAAHVIDEITDMQQLLAQSSSRGSKH